MKAGKKATTRFRELMARKKITILPAVGDPFSVHRPLRRLPGRHSMKTRLDLLGYESWKRYEELYSAPADPPQR